MKEQPLVSVIMPAYNAERFIGEAIKSVINQTYKNWELIVIDDCSTDKTLDEINKFHDCRIKKYQNYENKGISYTTNRAIEISSGKYIALLDDDDICMPDRLSKEVLFLNKNENIDIVGGKSLYIDESGQLIGQSPEPRISPKYNKSMLLFGGVSFSNSTALIRKEFIIENNLLFKDGCFGMQDVAFYMDASKCGNISAIEDNVLMYRIHSESETACNLERNFEQRKRKFVELQRGSLEKSGFCLDEKDYELIHTIMAEEPGKCQNKKEFEEFYRVLKKISSQAEKMNIDYLPELNHVLRTRFSWQIVKNDKLFEDF